MSTARVISGQVGSAFAGDVVAFRSLGSLARRAAGRRGEWRAEHSPAFDPPGRTVMLLRPIHGTCSLEVTARVWVDAATLAETPGSVTP